MPFSFLQCPLISSTLYFSFSLIMLGGGAGSLCWLTNSAFLQHINRSLLKTSYMAYSFRSSSLYPFCLISSLIVKGSYLFWSSFFEGRFVWIFFASSHTCSLTLRSCTYCLLLSYCLFIMSFVFSIAVLASSLVVSIFFSSSSKLSISVSTVRFPFQGYLP